MRVPAVALLALLLVSAGCVAPTGSSQSTPASEPIATTAADGQPTTPTAAEASTETVGQTTATDSTTTTESPEETPKVDGPPTMQSVYGIDQNQTLDRIERMLGVEATTPTVNVSAAKINRTEQAYRASMRSDPFLAAFGLDRSGDDPIRIAGYVDGPQSVVMNPNLTERQARGTLAHEFVHVVQFQTGWQPQWNDEPIGAYRARYGRGLQQVRTTITEGIAEYTQYSYRQAYLDGWANKSVGEQAAATERAFWNMSGATQLAWAPYVFGPQFVAQRVEATSEIPALYDAAPVTTEQILHNETQASEPPIALSATVDAPTVRWQGGQGELFTMVALAQELDQSQATTAAAGWGNDTLAVVEAGESTGFVWVTRWDSATDADQFESAIDEFATQRTTGPTFQSERVRSDTVVVLVGDDPLLDKTAVSESDGTVSVSVEASG